MKLSVYQWICGPTFTSGYNLWGSDHNNKSFFSEPFNFS